MYSETEPKDKALMVLGLLAAAVSGAAWPMNAIVIGEFVNVFGERLGRADFMERVSDLALYFLYIAIVAGVATYVQASLTIIVGNRLTNRLRARYLASVLRQEVAFFDTQTTTGGLIKTLHEDGLAVQAAISDKTGTFCQYTFTFLVGWIVAFVRGWDMTLVMLGCLPVMAVVRILLDRVEVRMAARADESYSRASGIAQQVLSQIRTVVSYGAEERELAQYAQLLVDPAKIGRKLNTARGVSIGCFFGLAYCIFAVAFVYGAWRATQGAYTGGQVLSVLLAALVGAMNLGHALKLTQTFQLGRIAGAHMLSVVRRTPAIDPDAPGEEPPQVKGHVELRHVTFAYPSRPAAYVFKDFCLTVPAGTTVALVGESGSGKSTVVGLIERFYDPLEGSVALDGRDLREYNLRWLRNQVGLVSQEPTLFATSIYDNIAQGRPGASAEEVEAAARAANAHSFVMGLPEGYKTQCGERGLQLSGGQKQRISIARAILRNPKVLCLDEATSALDTQSERLVQEALDRLVVGRTTVVVAHRLSTIQHADVIAVVGEGRVLEEGTHEQLLANPQGAYASLVRLQMRDHQSGAEEEEEEEEGADAEEEQKQVEGTQLWIPAVAAADIVASSHVALQIDAAPSLTFIGTTSAALHQLPLYGSRRHQQNASFQLQAAGSARNHQHGEAVARMRSSASKRAGSCGWQLQHAVHAEQLIPEAGTADSPAAAGRKGAAEGAAEATAAVAPAVQVPMWRLLSYNRPEWLYGVVGLVTSGAEGGVRPAFAFVLGSIVPVFYGDTRDLMSKARFWSLMFMTIGLGTLVAVVVQQWAFGAMGQELSRRIRTQLFRAILYQEIGWFDLDANASGVLSTRLASDASHLRGAVADTLGLVVQDLTCLVFGYLIGFIYMWRMALLVTGALPFIVLGAVINYRVVAGFETGASAIYMVANQGVSEAFAAVRVVQAYNLQNQVVSLYASKLQGTAGAMARRAHITGLLMGYSQFATFAIYSLIIWFGGYELDRGRASFEDMLKAYLGVLMAAAGLAQAGLSFPDIAHAKAAVQSIFPIIDRRSQIDASSTDGVKLPEGTLRGELELKGVRFVYPARPSVVVFRNFSLTIPAGTTVALVGESGSGKSTVVGLIERFYDPLEGSVALDGRDLREYNLRWLRNQFALVSQEPLLFSCSVLDNIRYGRQDASMEEVVEAARAANVHELIEGLPDKYDTQVGERGALLSGGQKQRIAIARAVLKEPKVLLLDEATSALDAQSERLVQEALDRIMVRGGLTSVVVAHRLSTIRNAHKIAVVHRGAVCEQGTHDELLALHDGRYAKLVEAQMGVAGGGGGASAVAAAAALTAGGGGAAVAATALTAGGGGPAAA